MEFLGESEVTLDLKGRFLLPQEIKKEFNIQNSADFVFVVKRGIENCLELIPLNRWEKILSRLQTLNQFDEEVRVFKRLYLRGATKIGVDSVGRILLPKGLIEYAGLKKDLILAPTVTEIEIWEKSIYNKQFFDNYSTQQFSELAKKVMGEKGLDL